MANEKYYTLSEEAVDKLCGLIRESHSISDGIDDEHITTNTTFSSSKIKNMLNEVAGYDDTPIKADIQANAEAIEKNKSDILLLKENVEFTPRFIGIYNVPWFIEGQGMINARLTQVKKNVFSLDVNGGGSAFTIEQGTTLLNVSIPIKRYNPSNEMVPYCSPVLCGATGGEPNFVGMLGYDDTHITLTAPVGKAITSISLANIIVYGELIED